MQTPNRRLIENHIAVLNDLVWFHQFAQHELDVGCRRLAPAASKLLTRDLFRGNPFADRFNIEVTQIPNFRANLGIVLHQLVLVNVYELLADYLEKQAVVLKHCGRRAWPAGVTGRSPEARFQDGWSKAGYPAMRPLWWDTFTYLRLRRHHYAHASATCFPRFASFVKTKGSSLNRHWRSRLNGLAIDFRSMAIFQMHHDEAISVIRVAQSWVRDMDARIAAQLSGARVVETVAQEQLIAAGGRDFRRNLDTVRSLARRVRIECREQWSYAGVTLPFAEAAINRIKL